MRKQLSMAEFLVLTGSIALWIGWFRIPPVESGGCISDRPTKAVQHIDAYRIHGEEEYLSWFRRTISASPFAAVPGYYRNVIDERSDLLVIPVSECTASFDSDNRLNGYLVFIRHDYVESSTTAQLLVVSSNAIVLRGTFASAAVVDVLIVALPIILLLVLGRNRHRRATIEESRISIRQ
ncbi:MAG: hypothetical protein AAF664_12880 [Planctomycetota bacterium]